MKKLLSLFFLVTSLALLTNCGFRSLNNVPEDSTTYKSYKSTNKVPLDGNARFKIADNESPRPLDR